MLKLKNIVKVYKTESEEVKALKGIDLEFRESEFVSILGQSGCGKTTLLNIIGGLDDYTKGDLIINGKSTKDFKDRDWDTYRNHSVGFVFQNYNLISHQTVLKNVELALTLSGVSKEERRKRAIKALEQVGLKNQINKKPNQMSGGQMQRVAIARALVNDPDILLADEPTGALDSKTSVQIMDILKEISKNKLVIMVTHNPELAEKYSTRIINLLDGKVVNDSDPYKSNKEDAVTDKKTKKTYMSFMTALSLSLNNLMTKKGRTLLTAFAGSIGIIGIALIMSLSNGVQEYIDRVQEDTLSSYPLTIEKQSVDLGAMMESMAPTDSKEEVEKDKVYANEIMNDMFELMSSKVTSNNLKTFKEFLDDNDEIKKYVNDIQYGYGLTLNIYNENGVNGLVKANPSTVLDVFGMNMSSNGTQMSFTSTDVFMELLDNKKLLESQYDILKGKLPTKYDEVVLIVDDNNKVMDYTLYSIGLMNQDELKEKYDAMVNGETVEFEKAKSYTYDELLDVKFKLLLNTDLYVKEKGLWVDKTKDEDFLKELLKDKEDIKIVGIIRPKKDSVISTTTGVIGYTSKLKEYVLNESRNSEIAKEQLENKDTNVFTGLEFSNDNDSFNYANLSAEQIRYLSSLSDVERANVIASYQESMSSTYEQNLQKLGIADEKEPTNINIYPKDFESKEEIIRIIDEYNEKQEKAGLEENVINYSDLVGAMMSGVSSIVNIISYVLMAFVSVSLVVSSIMIGIITYISVLERTKEIGILRAIGASKKDVSRVFNAETVIIGFVAGALGIIVTLILNIPINIIVRHLTGVSTISRLPFVAALILVAISMILTTVSGLIPSRVASKKDPVEALRTE